MIVGMVRMLLLGHKLTLLTSWKGEFVHDILEKGKKGSFSQYQFRYFPTRCTMHLVTYV